MVAGPAGSCSTSDPPGSASAALGASGTRDVALHDRGDGVVAGPGVGAEVGLGEEAASDDPLAIPGVDSGGAGR